MPCSTSPSQARTRRLLIECPLSVRQAFGAPDEWFETINSINYLQVFVQPTGYKRTSDRETSDGFIDTVNVATATIRTERVGFEAKVEKTQADILYLVEELANRCISSDRRSFTPITILDFVRPERSDRLAASGEFYTVRKGRILQLPEESGNSGTGTNLSGRGFSIVFKEREKRFVLG